MGNRIGWAAVTSSLGAWPLVAACATAASGQARITGRVVNAATGAPVTAATVSVSGTTVTTTATDSGCFVLRLPSDAVSLTVRRVGFLTMGVPLVTGRADYTIVLSKDVFRLDEQIVTGPATTVSGTSAASAVVVVTGQQVTAVPAPTIENAMQGQVTGALFEQNNGGAPGGGVQVQIRGNSSLLAGVTPLYVVDGIIVNNETIDPELGVNRISDLNPNDIASIQVLKGAAASSIYGSQGGSGVIVITTRKGTAGKPQWNFSQTVGHFSNANTLALRSFPTLASAQAWYVGDVTHDTGSKAAGDDAFIESVYAGPQNYQSQLFSNGQLSYASDLSVSGTEGGTQYFASGLLQYDNGPMTNTGYSKQSVRANVTQQLAKTLSVSVNLNYLSNDTRRGVSGSNDLTPENPYENFSHTPQFLALAKRNPDGSWPTNPFGLSNPFANAAEIETPQTLSRYTLGGSANWTPWKTEHQSIVLNALGGVDHSNLHGLYLAPNGLQVEDMEPLPGTAIVNQSTNEYSNYALNAIHYFTGLSDFAFTTSVGFERDDRHLTNPVTESYNLISGTMGTEEADYYIETKQDDQSWYAQEQVTTLAQRLTVTGTHRRAIVEQWGWRQILHLSAVLGRLSHSAVCGLCGRGEGAGGVWAIGYATPLTARGADRRGAQARNEPGDRARFRCDDAPICGSDLGNRLPEDL